jgi:hypothetical protein
MKNSNIPKDRLEAIASGRIEYATVEGAASRTHLIQFINVIRGLEMRGIEIPVGKIDYEALMSQVESRGLNIPGKPFGLLPIKEQRAFSDSLKDIKIPSITDNMSERQKELYHAHQMYKAGYTFRSGEWVKLK